jgi:FLVCR family feline leukemia virus subgroup C receptor-related protein
MPIIGGMVSSLFISSIVLRVGKYKPITLVLMFCSVALSAVFYVALLTESTVWVYINTFMLGFFLIPLIPVMIELSCELVYPISSSFAVGTLFSGSTLFTVLSS